MSGGAVVGLVGGEAIGRALGLVAFLVLCGATLYLSWARARVVYGGIGSSPASLTNCQSCGARVEATDPACRHCEAPLSGDSDPDPDAGDG